MNFNNLFGNQKLKNEILNLITEETLPHAVLLLGMDGIGKFGFARAAAVEITSLHSEKDKESIDRDENNFELLNIYYVIPTSVKGKGDNGAFTQDDYFKSLFSLKEEKNPSSGKIPLGYIQYIISQLKYRSFHNTDRIVIIRDAHLMTREAQNALLKILEEPPDRVFFILTSSNEDKLLQTIISRCSRYLMSNLTENEMKEFVSKNAITLKDTELLLLLANGSPGNLVKYADFNIDEISENLAFAFRNRKLTNIIADIDKKIKKNKDKKQLILNIYNQMLVLLLYFQYIDNNKVFNYDLNLKKDKIERAIDRIIEMEKNSTYNLSWETEWGLIFYNLIGG